MERDTATELFLVIEKRMSAFEGDTCPTFDVRLDAVTDRQKDTRDYRLRVTGGNWPVETADWAWLMDELEQAGRSVALDNAAALVT